MYAQESIKPYGDQGSKSSQVERMFDGIAHSYDFLNHLLSLGVDKLWRKRAIRHLKHNCPPGSSVLDVATGTGDFAILARKKLKASSVVGIDISEKMLEIGRKKALKSHLEDVVTFKKADCSNLPFAEGTFDAVISAFALRNFEDLDSCLEEMRRVLRPGGMIVVIDLCSPRRFPMRQLFWCYKKLLMPIIGHSVSKDASAYSYLPETMDAVIQGEDMRKVFDKAGFQDTSYKRLTFQMCMLYSGKK